jgi:hypothetical protein
MAQIVARQRIRNRQVIQQALELRKTGATYLQIGRYLNLSTTRVYQLVRAGIDEINAELKETASDLRQMELDRLDAIHLAHWPHRAKQRATKPTQPTERTNSEHGKGSTTLRALREFLNADQDSLGASRNFPGSSLGQEDFVPLLEATVAGRR